MMFIMFTTLEPSMILSLLPNRPSLTVVKGLHTIAYRHGGVRDGGCKLLDTRQEGLAMDSRGLRLSTRAGISRQIHSGNNLICHPGRLQHKKIRGRVQFYLEFVGRKELYTVPALILKTSSGQAASAGSGFSTVIPLGTNCLCFAGC